MRLYVAGPITGVPNLNRHAFESASVALVQAGYLVCCPFDNGLDVNADWADHMRADIRMLLDCDAVALLPGWLDSRGARLEEFIASQLEMSRRSLDWWLWNAREKP